MDILLIFILVAVIGFFTGYILREVIMVRDLLRVRTNLNAIAQAKQTEQRRVKTLKHEVITDVHYFYLEEDQSFICQGPSLDEAAFAFTQVQGKNQLGVFKSAENGKFYVFANNKCLEWGDNIA